MTYGTGGTGDSGDVMAAGTDPALAPLPGGGYEIAYQASDGTVDITGSQAVGRIAPAAPGSSGPALTNLQSGGFEVACHGVNGQLWTYGTAGSTDTGQPMAAATSPAVGGLAPSGLEIAYQGPPPPPVVSAPSAPVTNPIPVRKPTITSLASGRVKGSHGRKPHIHVTTIRRHRVRHHRHPGGTHHGR